jgi:hypothetical protein
MEVINQLGNIDVFSILKETNSIMEGHFKLSSGYHSNFYLQCAKLLQYPDKTALIIEKGLEIFGNDLNEKKNSNCYFACHGRNTFWIYACL